MSSSVNKTSPPKIVSRTENSNSNKTVYQNVSHNKSNVVKDVVNLEQLDKEIEQNKLNNITNTKINSKNENKKEDEKAIGYNVSGRNVIELDSNNQDINVWKTALNKAQVKNVEEITTNKDKDYIDKTINKTEKLSFNEVETNKDNESNKIISDNNVKINQTSDVSKTFKTSEEINIKNNLNKDNLSSTIISENTNISKDDLNESKNKLGPVKDKKPLSETLDLNSSLTKSNINNEQDYSNIKSKIDNKNYSNTYAKNTEKEDELKNKYEQLQKENKEKLDEYRDMIIKMKKEKRNDQAQKDQVKMNFLIKI